MTTVNVVGSKPRSLELQLPEVNQAVLFDVVQWQLAKRRRGTAATKTRAVVSRTGKKMYSQKGTGNARHGDRAAPIYVGGGVAHGPQPRDYGYTLPKRVRKLGLQMAVADRAASGKVLGLDGVSLDGKTKTFLAWAKTQGLDGSERVLLVTNDENTLRSARNLKWVTPVKAAGLNVYDILRHERLVADAALLESDVLKYEGKKAGSATSGNANNVAKKPASKTVVAKASGTSTKPAASVSSNTVTTHVAAAAPAKVETPKAEPQAVAQPAASVKAAASTDDLKRVEGIGPKINDALIAAGIDTFAKLEGASEDQLKAALEAASLRFAPSLGTWAEQAGYLVRGDEAGFKALTDSLVAGRKEEGEA